MGRGRPCTDTSTFPAAPSSSQMRRPRSDKVSPSSSVFSASSAPVAEPRCAEIQQSPRVAVIVTRTAGEGVATTAWALGGGVSGGDGGGNGGGGGGGADRGT